MSFSERSKPQVQEFKNAFHVGRALRRAHGVQLQISPQRNIKEGASHFRLSPIGQHFRDIELSPSRSKSALDGLGITVQDSGHLLIAEWKGNLVDGRYFLFRPNLGEQAGRSNYSALCQYGWMKSGVLNGQNYVYNITGTLARGTFQANRIVGKCHIIHNNKMFVANQSSHLEQIDCEVVSNNNQTRDDRQPPNHGSPTKNQSSNFLKIPKISVSGVKQTKFPSSFQQVNSNLFIRPNKFLQQLVSSYQEGDRSSDSLVYTRLSERQFFLGFLQSNKIIKSKIVSEDDKMTKITGFGVMLKNQWPISYGTFKEGKLSGLGRVYETQMNLFDGYFLDGELMEGFIIDYIAQTTSFGHKSTIDPSFHSSLQGEDCFVITNSFQTLSSEYMTEYRKSFHLRSLNFNNGYFCSPKLIHRSPWPYTILDRLTRRSQIQSIIRSFRPTLRDMQISQIQKVGHSSQNRVEKMLVQEIREFTSPAAREEEVGRQQVLRQKSSFIKNQIQKSLREKDSGRDEDSREKAIVGYVKEYKRLERRKTEIVAANRSKTKSSSKKDESIRQTSSHQSFDLLQGQLYSNTERHPQPRQQHKSQSRLQTSRHYQYYDPQYSPKNMQAQQQSQCEPRIELEFQPQPIQSKPQTHTQPQPPSLPAKPTSPKRIVHTPKKLKQVEPQPQGDPMTPPKESQLTLLVHEYQLCQTERKNTISSGNMTRRSTTEGKQTSRELHSKRELMQQDYVHFLGLEKRRSPTRGYHPRVRVDLDLIYRQHLRK